MTFTLIHSITINGLIVVVVPVRKTNFGAVHTPISAEILELLGVKHSGDLALESHEVAKIYSVWGPRQLYSHYCYLIPTVGTYLAVVIDNFGAVVAEEIKPTRGLLVPPDTWFAVQALNRNRIGLLTFYNCWATGTSDGDDSGMIADFAPHWLSASSDPVMLEHLAETAPE